RLRGFFRTVEIAGRPAPLAGSPCVFSGTPAVEPRPAPPLGSGRAAWDRAPASDAARGAAAAGGVDGRSAVSPAGVVGTPTRAADGRGAILAGMRVINLGVGAVGPEICWALGELGAEVIKIESNANLDFLRALSLEPGMVNRAWIFNAECRGQKSVLLNLTTDEGRELARRLCALADVVVENNRGGVVASWGLDYDDVRAVKPDIVYIASQGFGRGGPLGRSQA